MERAAARVYDSVMWKDRWLAAVYWFAIAVALLAVGASGLLAPFFELEVIVPLVVGLLGVFIALWLANRERNKRITENHFYKLHILWHVWRMLDNVSTLFGEWDLLYMHEQMGDLEKSSDEVIKELREAYVSEYYYFKSQIEVLNVNTYVPSDIRHCVLLLVRTAGIPLRWYHPRAQIESNIVTIEKQLLDPLGQLIDSKYFTKDYDNNVMEKLGETNSIRRGIRERVKSWKKTVAAANHPW